MELYTWPEDRLMIRLHEDEHFYRQLTADGGWSSEQSEMLFAVLFQIICDHFNIGEDAQLHAEISRSWDDVLLFIIECMDEEGQKLKMNRPSSGKSELLFRFAAKEDLISFSEQAQHHDLTGGTLLFFYPFSYLLFEDGAAASENLEMLMEEYGERSCLNTADIREKGTVLQEKNALQFLAAGYGWNM
ncbi:hypothetical protein [Salibacterium halotolerans]|uniref:Adapter protein MecA 1/2 n=1 Tax=Salibacterium halotolerans TaxID=1884432 RepID=A0A1I5Q2N9_9BACI|nr:hypothetical protein [Salibacterium halotolerans]SFP40482.1 hypothetical protein SAMN05518683_1058 [Salibacterium halotolerans]